MLNIALVVVPHPPAESRLLTVKARSGQIISQSSQSLIPGDYDVYASDGDSIQINQEPFVRRLPSSNLRSREAADFQKGVQARDGKCVFTGIVNRRAHLNKWVGWEAAYIFPPEREDISIENDFDRLITGTESGGYSDRSAPIYSTRNGLLLQTTIFQLFVEYSVSVNADDGYKITSFIPDDMGVDGRILDPVCRNPDEPNHVSDDLLRWHFRQSVLGNMRGAGEPSFEHDYPPGSDMLKEILEGPYPNERFEMELSLRLRGWEDPSGFVR
ncbi:hypothetical protein POX_b02524 [Penicillium oxalicum]|uniref:hypothetical protein n=1 Tax=Penicillium oxalicum TaxID=69781 RepID=UPI0020B7A6D0|nr:hypothetical protein POX_b02524 [Penicillium oxalicum]KAI2792486.1 hypothetical protein POX_b02524 [Penicillium oxalicum]